MRDPPAGDGPTQLLMIERARGLAFAGGATVFPGGAVDAADHALADALADPPEDGAARIAAIRETIEETGVAAALPGVTPAAVAALQAGLLAGRPFAALLAEQALAPDLSALVPFARWLPPADAARRFDTRFYLARDPVAADRPRLDPGETTRAWWQAAADVLADPAARLIFPTRRNLERLAAYPTMDGLVAHARSTPVRPVSPVVREVEGVTMLTIADGLGYPVLGEPLESAERG